MLILCIYSISCEPLVNQFEDYEEAKLFQASGSRTAPEKADTIRVMTWNIRFGAGRTPWFGDGCGSRVIFSKEEIYVYLEKLAYWINTIKPDILLLQEVDIKSKRTGYIDEVQWLLNHTHLNYGAYASMWEAQYIPSDGLGRINTGNATLSRWHIAEAERIQLPVIGDKDALTTYFYLRRNILKTKIDLPGVDNFYVVNTHLEAFSTDDTKLKQVRRLEEELSKLSGFPFIAGGDFNLLPPGSDSTDYCMEDRCADESFHQPGDNPFHKEGSDYTPEADWLQGMYDLYQADITLSRYLADQAHYFTHTTNPAGAWDRKIDYLFTNRKWISFSDSTWQAIRDVSDHIPVSVLWEASQ
jgi:endonuclease/exonuclease/phosphatase family metal-dependent hydrolase